MNSIKKREIERHNKAYEESKKVKDRPRNKLTKKQRDKASILATMYGLTSAGY